MSQLPAWFAILMLVPASSCATVVTGMHDVINVNSSPSGAKFTTNTGAQGVTPAKVEVPDSVDVTFTFDMDGYHQQNHVATRHMSGWVWGNILIGGIIGLVVDLASGGIYTHTDNVNVALALVVPVTPVAPIASVTPVVPVTPNP